MKNPLGFISFYEALLRTGYLDPEWSGDELQVSQPFDLPPALQEAIRGQSKESDETQQRASRSWASQHSADLAGLPYRKQTILRRVNFEIVRRCRSRLNPDASPRLKADVAALVDEVCGRNELGGQLREAVRRKRPRGKMPVSTQSGAEPDKERQFEDDALSSVARELQDDGVRELLQECSGWLRVSAAFERLAQVIEVQSVAVITLVDGDRMDVRRGYWLTQRAFMAARTGVVGRREVPELRSEARTLAEDRLHPGEGLYPVLVNEEELEAWLAAERQSLQPKMELRTASAEEVEHAAKRVVRRLEAAGMRAGIDKKLYPLVRDLLAKNGLDGGEKIIVRALKEIVPETWSSGGTPNRRFDEHQIREQLGLSLVSRK